jgi:hypothetical protein
MKIKREVIRTSDIAHLLHTSSNTGLVKIMLTLMDYFSPADRLTPLTGTVVRWLLCVKHNGEQVETVL